MFQFATLVYQAGYLTIFLPENPWMKTSLKRASGIRSAPKAPQAAARTWCFEKSAGKPWGNGWEFRWHMMEMSSKVGMSSFLGKYPLVN